MLPNKYLIRHEKVHHINNLVVALNDNIEISLYGYKNEWKYQCDVDESGWSIFSKDVLGFFDIGLDGVVFNIVVELHLRFDTIH